MKKIKIKNSLPFILLGIDIVLGIGLLFCLKQSFGLNLQAFALGSQMEEMAKMRRAIKKFDAAKFNTQQSALKKIPIQQSVPLEAMKAAANIARELKVQEVNIAQIEQGAQAQAPAANIKTLPFEIKATCEYERVMPLIEGISRAPVLMHVRGLKITRNEKKLPRLEVELSVDGYTQLIPQKPTSKKKSPLP